MEDFGFAKRREKGDQGWEMDVHDKVDNDDVTDGVSGEGREVRGK